MKMTRMDRLRKIAEEIEKQQDPQELTDLALYLNSFRERLQVRSMGIAEQRNACCAAMLAKDKAALRMFLQSQFEEIRSWARENLTPPGPPQWPRITV